MQIYSPTLGEQVEVYTSIKEPQYVENIPLSLQQKCKINCRNCVVLMGGKTIQLVKLNRTIKGQKAAIFIKEINKYSRKRVQINK